LIRLKPSDLSRYEQIHKGRVYISGKYINLMAFLSKGIPES